MPNPKKKTTRKKTRAKAATRKRRPRPAALELHQEQMVRNIENLLEAHANSSEFLDAPQEYLGRLGMTIDKEGLDELNKLKEVVSLGKFDRSIIDTAKLGAAIHPEVASSTSSATSSMTSSATSSGI